MLKTARVKSERTTPSLGRRVTREGSGQRPSGGSGRLGAEGTRVSRARHPSLSATAGNPSHPDHCTHMPVSGGTPHTHP